MRCKIKGCLQSSRTPNQHLCWSKFRLCFPHCVELHPESYKIKLDVNNLTSRRQRPLLGGRPSKKPRKLEE